jgi:hypothetical protein
MGRGYGIEPLSMIAFSGRKHSGRGIKYKLVSSQNYLKAFGEHKEHVKFNLLEELLR